MTVMQLSSVISPTRSPTVINFKFLQHLAFPDIQQPLFPLLLKAIGDADTILFICDTLRPAPELLPPIEKLYDHLLVGSCPLDNKDNSLQLLEFLINNQVSESAAEDYFRSEDNYFLREMCRRGLENPTPIFDLLFKTYSFYTNYDFANGKLLAKILKYGHCNIIDYLFKNGFISYWYFLGNNIIPSSFKSNNFETVKYITGMFSGMLSTWKHEICEAALLYLSEEPFRYVVDNFKISIKFIYENDLIFSMLILYDLTHSQQVNIARNMNLLLAARGGGIPPDLITHYQLLHILKRKKGYEYIIACMLDIWTPPDRKAVLRLLRMACKYGRLGVVKIIIEKYRLSSDDFWAKNQKGSCALSYGLRYPSSIFNYLTNQIFESTSSEVLRETLGKVRRFEIPDECSICLEETDRGDLQVGITCGHASMCGECSKKIVSLACPLCREETTTVSLSLIVEKLETEPEE
jgi:hypothetical protein